MSEPARKTSANAHGAWVALGNKPERVNDRYAYWTDPPPERSARCNYWMAMLDVGWRPNRRLSMMGYDEAAEWYGVYIWEYQHVLRPSIRRLT